MTPQTLQKVSFASWDWAEMRRFCFSQALRVVHSPADADEVAQEAVLRAWRHSDSCRQPDQPYGWLGRIAHNEAVRLVSRRPNEVLVDEPLPPAGEPGGSDGVEIALLIEGVLASLSPADQQLARLRYYEDLTCASVADRLGISESIVKVRLHRLRRRLRQRLEEEI
jgi:RNA polymerase sigma-70 factor, ECF subfamily